MPRPVRSDARRNAERLRDAAAAVFMKSGINAPLEDVAREAGVSIGTLYNHFSNRQELLDAVLPAAAASQLSRIQAAVDAATTARGRIESYLREVFAVQASDRLLSDALSTLPLLPAEAARTCNEVMTLGRDVITDARSSGETVFLDEDDLVALVLGNSLVQRAGAPEGWDRFLSRIARS